MRRLLTIVVLQMQQNMMGQKMGLMRQMMGHMMEMQRLDGGDED